MITNTPYVSVILPTFNRAHLLPRAIASVISQSFSDFELIVVDDGSTDNTTEVMEKVNDPRVVYIPSECNGGDAAARNRGAARARGEWLAFQDSDDEWLPGKLENQVYFARTNTNANLISGGSLRIAGTELSSHYWPVTSQNTTSTVPVDIVEWMGTAIANLQGMLIRREILEKLGGFDTRYRVISDADLVYRLIENNPHALFSNRQAVVLMHDTQGSLVQNLDNLRYDLKQLLIQHERLLRQFPSAWARLRYRLALNELQCGDMLASRRATCAAIAADPGYLRAWAYLSLSIAGERCVQRIRMSSQRIHHYFNHV